MQMEHSDLVVISSKARSAKGREERGELARIGVNAYADWRRLQGTGQPWEVRMRVAEARIISIQRLVTTGSDKPQPGSEPIFTSESALVILGLQPWWNNPDVTLRRAKRSGHRPEVPPVRLPGGTVPAVRFGHVRHDPGQLGVGAGRPATFVQAGIAIAPAHLVIYDLCRLLHPLQAFHDVSLLLRYSARWDSRDLAGSERRLKSVKQKIANDLAELGPVPRIRRTRAILNKADAAIESPAESIVLWTLLSMVKDSSLIATQIPVLVRGHKFRIDVGVPAVQLAIEVTGLGKFGDTNTAAHEVAGRFVHRQQMLESVGWRVVNITYEQAKALPELMARLREVLSEHGIPTTVPDRLLWEVATPELMARNRRF